MSKYSQFLAYDPEQDRILTFEWDVSFDGVDRWFHYDGEESWYVSKRSYIAEARKRFVILDVVPEHVHREGGGYI